MKMRMSLVLTMWMLFTVAVAGAQQQRPPAVPLVTHNPYFSIWSMDDKLTDNPTKHWTGTNQPLVGLIRIDGKVYRYMGGNPRDVPVMEQKSVSVHATHTLYTFEAAGLRMIVSFFTPAFPQDIDLLSRPVTYLTWSMGSIDHKSHQVQLLLDVSGVIAVNTDDQKVVWGRTEADGLHVLNIGSQDQQMLKKSGDNLRIDWGYFHLAVPTSQYAQLSASRDAVKSFVDSGKLPTSDDMEMPYSPSQGAAHLATALTVNVAPVAPVTRHVLLSYTEGYAIEYMGRRERPYWQRNNKEVQQMLTEAENDYTKLEARGNKYDAELDKDMESVGGVGYRELALLAYRQTLAAHGLVADEHGKPQMFEKENFSCGCIGTVDVMYPASPFFFFFNPDLLEAQMRPVLDYAMLPGWTNPWAPHDLGRYPLANGHGQLSVDGPTPEEESMPVEESGNMLIMAAELGKTQGNYHLAKEYWPLLTKWAEFLREKGMDPENQLCTDDFAGKLAHNTNLSIKAIDGLGAYAEMARGLGDAKTADEYDALAKQMAVKWEQMANDGDHYKLAFDKSGTWSQKYNLVWDDVLGLHLFAPKVRQTEVAFYLKHMNQYGLPLDIRADYTKTDWELWTATLAENPKDFASMIAPIVKWTNETPTRVPLTDWYNTKTGVKTGFQARSVVGGIYIKALSDPALAGKWQKMDVK